MALPQSIFQTQLDVKTSIFAILLFIFCIGLYHSLFTNLLKKYLQELYFATKHFQSPLNRSIIYLLMISLPMILLTLISLFYNNSMIGIEISMTFDQLNILIVAGYICWIQESRHTPIRGMPFVRDTIFAIAFVSLFIDFFYSRKNQLEESIPVVVIWIVYYFILAYFDSIQQFLMKILGLKESNNYNAKFLLTSKHNIPDFLEVKDLISEKQQQIQEELRDYHEILANLQQNEEDQQILMNFAKLFLPIKKAYEIKEQMENEQFMKEIQACWEEGSNCDSERQQHQEQHIYKSPTWNQSSDGFGLYLKSTYTDDFINEGQQQEEPSLYEKLIKYAFYPIYCCSQAAGRLYYLSGYLGIILLIGSAFGISNASTYFSSTINSLSIVSIIVSLCMIYPSARYCIQISSNNDYDFTNMFLQSMIFKLFLFSVFLIVLNIFFSGQISVNNGAFMCLIVRGILLLIYLGFMAINRFATRFNNFKFFCGFVIVAQVTKVLAENIYNSRSSSNF